MTLLTPNYSFPYPQSTDVPDGASQIQALAGAVDTALHASDVNITALQAQNTLVTYTPTFTMGTPNGTVYGEYYQFGKLVVVSATFTATTGVSLDVGNITCSMPFASAAPGKNMQWTGEAVFGGGAGYIGDVILGEGSSTATIFMRHTLAGTIATPGNSGVSFAVGNFITVNLTYRKA